MLEVQTGGHFHQRFHEYTRNGKPCATTVVAQTGTGKYSILAWVLMQATLSYQLPHNGHLLTNTTAQLSQV